MQGSINFDGTLSGAISGGGGGGGSEISITPTYNSGTKIADITLDNVEKDLYIPNPIEVEITQIQQSGTKIASIDVDGEVVDLYAPTPQTPTEVIVTPTLESGIKVATIEVDGVNNDLYAPEGGEVNYSTNEQVVGTYKGDTLYEKIIHIIEPSEIISQTYTTEIQTLNANVIFCLTARIMLGSLENYKWVTIPYFNSINYNTAIMLSNTELVVISQGWKYKEVELIVQYTKND